MKDRIPQPASVPAVKAGPSAPAKKLVLVLNAGSSSLKIGLFDCASAPVRILSGAIDRIGSTEATCTLRGEDGQPVEREQIGSPSHASGLEHLLLRIEKRIGTSAFQAVGHRVVHGGPRYCNPQRVDGAMLAELHRIRSFDPEHLPSEIALMELLAVKFPGVPQVACFDTAFHSTMPRVAKLLSIPRRYEAQGVHRYGFHGLSYAYLMQELERAAGTAAANGRIILAHLGNGASMAAVLGGRSMDTTMSFTPAAGLVMSTRSGDVDPGLFSFLERSEQMTASRFDRMVNHESGLLGVSETSSDMRDLLALEDRDVRAAEAIELFCREARKRIGAYAAVLGGLDTLVFAGGIGENAPPVRARICEGLGFLGIDLNESRNKAHASVISTDASRATVRVIRTDEELMIARSVSSILGLGAEN